MCEALVSAMSGVCVEMYITCGYRTPAMRPNIPGAGSKEKYLFFLLLLVLSRTFPALVLHCFYTIFSGKTM